MVQTGELAVKDSTAAKSVGESQASMAIDSIGNASADSVAAEEPRYGLLLTPPQPVHAPQRPHDTNAVSYIIGGVFILFLIVALRFRNNIKYATTMFQSLVETRTRHNVFDDTVRETSLIVLLNILWCVSAGIIGYAVISYYNPAANLPATRWIGMLAGMGIAGIYTIFMWCAYSCVGWVFSDREHTRLWIKGFSASQALMSPLFFFTALVAAYSPDTAPQVAAFAIIVFILGKLVFIWKGYRIFFNQFSSWVLFLCYLCSLEIIPLILCYRGAVLLDSV